MRKKMNVFMDMQEVDVESQCIFLALKKNLATFQKMTPKFSAYFVVLVEPLVLTTGTNIP